MNSFHPIRERWRRFIAHPLFFPLLFAGFLLSRLAIVWLRVPWMAVTTLRYDYIHFYLVGELSARGAYPFIDFWMEYPPIYPWITVGIYRLSELVSPLIDLKLFYFGATALFYVAAEVGILWLIVRIAGRTGGRERAVAAALTYGLLFVPYYLWYGLFDPLPAFLLLFAIDALQRGKDGESALAAALGFSTKLFPVVLIPIGIALMARWGRRIRYALVFAIGVLATILPFVILGPTATMRSLSTLLDRSSWETVWALLDGYYGYGVVSPIEARFDEYVGPGGDALSSRWGLYIAGFFGLLFLMLVATLWIRRMRLTSEGNDSFERASLRFLVPGVGLGLNLLLLYSKGYSPQFLVWFAPFLALCFPNRYGVIYLAILGITNVAEYPLYFVHFPDQLWMLFASILGRTAVLLVSSVHYLALIQRRSVP